jgi:uncharacterized repeat protein (TIGR01451 family)
MKTLHGITLVIALATLGAGPIRAQGAPTPAAGSPTPLAISAENRTAAADSARGARRTDATLRAGDVVRYRLAFSNTAGRPLRHVQISDPIPVHLRLVAGSAHAERADVRLEYSADGGRSWAAEPLDTVVVDGRSVTRPVPAERYTTVRWTVEGWIQPAATVAAEFEARMAPVAATARQQP